jgi:hypothetical protein
MNERAEGLLEGLGVAAYFAMKNKSQPKRLLNELADMTLRVQLLVAASRIDITRAETQSLLPSNT